MESKRKRLYIIIFGSDTKAGKLFDVVLLWAILLSVLAVMLETVGSIEAKHGQLLSYIEWFFTILFTIEYIARIIAIKKPVRYIFSFFGIVDFLSIIPTYLSLFLVGSHVFSVIRAIRLLRIFRILKLARYMQAANMLGKALKESRAKIIVFVGVVMSVAIIIGTLMYLIEGPENGFTSIPRGIYWAIVTLTTVGFGDITPATVIGQFFASLLMIMGYGIIAVPTGIVTSEVIKKDSLSEGNKLCSSCQKDTHEEDANYCKFCGGVLELKKKSN